MLDTYISLAVQISFSSECFCFLQVLLFLCVVLLRSLTNNFNHRIAYDDVALTNHTLLQSVTDCVVKRHAHYLGF